MDELKKNVAEENTRSEQEELRQKEQGNYRKLLLAWAKVVAVVAVASLFPPGASVLFALAIGYLGKDIIEASRRMQKTQQDLTKLNSPEKENLIPNKEKDPLGYYTHKAKSYKKLLTTTGIGLVVSGLVWVGSLPALGLLTLAAGGAFAVIKGGNLKSMISFDREKSNQRDKEKTQVKENTFSNLQTHDVVGANSSEKESPPAGNIVPPVRENNSNLVGNVEKKSKNRLRKTIQMASELGDQTLDVAAVPSKAKASLKRPSTRNPGALKVPKGKVGNGR